MTFDVGREVFGAAYALGDHEQLPDPSTLASLGCGNPTVVIEHEGEAVLNRGSGVGTKYWWTMSAKRVGATGDRTAPTFLELLALPLMPPVDAHPEPLGYEPPHKWGVPGWRAPNQLQDDGSNQPRAENVEGHVVRRTIKHGGSWAR